MTTLWQDVRYGVRMLVREPGFTAVVVITLALGIGANTAVFSVVNALMLQPMPVPHPEQITVLTSAHRPGDGVRDLMSYLDVVDYRANTSAFQDICAYRARSVGLSTGKRADRIVVSYVTGNFFSMFGVTAAAGRLIGAGSEPVVVLGHSYWRRRFAASADVVGMPVRINGVPHTIVGVVAETFLGGSPFIEMDAYLPLEAWRAAAPRSDPFAKRDNRSLHVHGRLKPAVSVAQAQANVDLVARQLEREYPDTNARIGVDVVPELQSRPEPSYSQQNPLIATVFLALVGLVLLVACVNVANLLMARATVRGRELAIRAGLGAGRLRLMRQMLTESLLLALLGGAAGALVGSWASSALASIHIPMDLPVRFDFPFDWRAFVYATSAALLTGILVGIVPAMRASRIDLTVALREGGRGHSGAGHHGVRNMLVGAQMAGSLVLLLAAGLFVRSLAGARHVDLGFQPDGILNASVDVAQQGYDEARGTAFFRDVKERVKALPGAQAVTWGSSVPMSYYTSAAYVDAEGQSVSRDRPRLQSTCNFVDHDYVRTMGVRLLGGRDITEHDDADSPRVAIVNQTLADRLWPGQDAIGKRFSYRGPDGPWVQVVAIAANGKYDFIGEDPTPHFYAPLAQDYRAMRTLHVRVTGASPASLALTVQKEIRAVDPDLPVFDVRSMNESLRGGPGFFLLEIGAAFAAALGGLGLVLAGIGVYGVVSYTVSRRTREVGVCMALGAQPKDVLGLVLRQGLTVVAAGIGAGVLASLALGGLLGKLLLGVSSRDPVTLLAVSALLGSIALLACWIPARRACRVDPVCALRCE